MYGEFEQNEVTFLTVGQMLYELTSIHNMTKMNIDIYAHYDVAKEVIEEAVMNGMELKNVEIEEPEAAGYCKEYVVSLFNGEIWCEKAYRYEKDGANRDGYISGESPIYVIHEDCSSEILKIAEKDDFTTSIITFSLLSDEELESLLCDCEDCE